MDKSIEGIHHVTAIVGDPQQNINFYLDLLGLRLVKRTVNFDDPGTYHFYFGDEQGSPGTIITFFPWPRSVRGYRGTGQVGNISFSIPMDAVDYWVDRLTRRGIMIKARYSRLQEQVIAITDPHGLSLELVAHNEKDERKGWSHGPVPNDYTIRGIFGVTLIESEFQPTDKTLTMLGFHIQNESGNRRRYEIGAGGAGTFVDIVRLPHAYPGRIAVGTVHHVAWRTPSDEQQLTWLHTLITEHYEVTPVRDRKYFHSIYFNEPGGILFEIATDPPGFTVDEPLESLGMQLQLPSWLESERAKLDKRLPALEVPLINEPQ